MSRLLVVADTMVGGLGAVARDHARWFGEHGWQVTLAAPAPSGAADGPPQPGGAAGVVDLPVPGSARQIRLMLRAAGRLRHAAADVCADIVHVHGMRSAAIATVAGIRRPFVSVHGVTAMASDPPMYHAVRRSGRAVVARLAAEASSAEPGYGTGWRYLAFASALLPGLDGLPFPPAGSIPTFAWLGALDARKQPDVFIRALAELAGTGRRVRGIVAGDGPRAAEMAELVRTTNAPVELVGHASPRRVLAEAWAVALFSRGEGTPLAVEEAMWAGRPVVASRLPGIEYLMGTTGWLAGDANHAAAAFAELCDHDVARAAGAASGRRIRAVIAPDDPWPALEQAYRRRLR